MSLRRILISHLAKRIAEAPKHPEELHLDAEELEKLASLRLEIGRSKSAKAGEAKWQEFLDAKYDGGKKQVPNTNPDTRKRYPKVSVTTLLKSDQGFQTKLQEEFTKWIEQAAKSKKETPKKPESGGVFGVKFNHTYKVSLDDRKPEVRKAFEAAEVSEHDLADLAGVSALPSLTKEVRITTYEGKLAVRTTDDPPVEEILRTFDFEKKIMKNESLFLSKDAPKGLGTKVLASQIDKAKQLGMKKMVCEAVRHGSSMIGYKVWPRLGYDGEVPSSVKIPDTYKKKLKAEGHKEPFRIQQLYSLGKDAIEWWDKSGDSFEAEFDLADDSLSMRIFKRYLEEKGGYNKLAA